MRDDWHATLDDSGGPDGRGPDRPAGPRFCPGCARPRASHSGLCPECGDRLEPQGYCAVCEAFWPLAADEPCPKHEIALAPEAPDAAPPIAAGARIDWVTVGTYALPYQAEAARLRLDAEAIPTLLDGERMGANTLYHLATGGIRLQVPRALAQDARVLLSQSWSVPADDDDDEHDEHDLDWDEVAPARDGTGDWRTSLLFWGVVLLLLVVLAGLIGLTRS